MVTCIKKRLVFVLAITMLFATVFSASFSKSEEMVYAATANAQYSLQGAVYYVYTNSGCTTRAKDINGNNAVLTTKADGTTGELELNKGTYYVKEYSASKGYALDTKVYTAVVNSGETTWVNSSSGVKEVPQSAPISIQKVDGITGNASAWPGASLAGAEFEIKYTDGSSITRTWKVRTDSNGFANLDDSHFVSGDTRYKNSAGNYVVPLGTVTVKETKAPSGYGVSDEVFTITIKGDGTTSETTKSITGSGSKGGTITTNPLKVTYKDYPQSAPFSIQKVDMDTGAPTPAALSEFKNAQFEVKYTDGSTTRTWNIKTDENGLADLNDSHFVSGDARYKNSAGSYVIPLGTVTVKETQAPLGYAKNDEVYTITVSGNTNGNENSPTVTGSGSKDGTMTTNPIKISFRDKRQSAPISIQKIDAETGKASPMGSAELKDAEFEIEYTAGDSAWVGKKWRVKTDENGLLSLEDDYFVSGDARYKNTAGKYALPLGTVTVKEVKPPKGYVRNTQVYTLQVKGDTSNSETTSAITGSGVTSAKMDANPLKVYYPNQVIRGDIELIKIDQAGQLKPGIPFVIRSVTTGEMHVFVTSTNGHASTEAAPSTEHPNRRRHSYNTNSCDSVIDSNGKPILVDGEHVNESVLDSDIGIWFSKDKAGNTVPVEDALGALPYDTYYVTELPVTENDGKHLFKNIKFVVESDGVTIDGGTRTNPNLNLATEAKDSYSNNKYGTRAENDSIIDRVSYSGLTPGITYVLKAEAHWAKNAGSGIVDGGIVKDANGNDITAERTIKPTTPDGFINMTIGAFDSTKLFVGTQELKDADVVIFQNLYMIDEGSEVLLYEHNDAEDEDQTIYYPWIGTTLTDSTTGIRMGLAREDMELVDTIEYYNLAPYYTYTVDGTLYDKETGDVVVDAKGQEVRATRKIRLTSQDGTFPLNYVLDSSNLENKSVISAVEIYGGPLPSISHEDMEDENQTLHIPKIRTKAYDADTEDEVGKVVGTFTDVVTYQNLLPGYSYKMKAEFMDKETGNSTGATTEKAFSVTPSASDPTRADGEVTITYPLSGKFTKESLEGKTLVAFEECLVEEKPGNTPPQRDTVVAIHKDINDASQTIHYPKIRTTGIDGKTDDHVGTVEESGKIKDTVTYWNLVPGKEYTIKGKVVDKDNGNTLATAEDLTFTATEADAVTGSKEIVFNLNSSSLVGHTAVVYEKLFHNNVEVTQHEEINDETQSVHYPWLRTTAVDELTGDHVSTIFGRLINLIRGRTGEGIPVDQLETIIDTVEYRNLISGETYTIVGTLMSKETESPITKENGEPITSSVTLNAGSHGVDGSVKVKFLVDSSQFTDNTFVCFEKLYHKNPVTNKDIEVNRHEDINDLLQSVHAVEIKTTAIDTHTADHVGDTTKTTTIDDAVEMKNLVGGMEYTLTGTLYVKETGEKLLDANGNPYTGTKTFIAEGTENDRVDLTEHVTINVDGRLLEDKTIVVYEDLYHNDIRITTHSDIEDEAQSVHFPKIETLATDSKTKDHVGTVSANEKVIDTVSLKNLIPGQKYTVSGKLMKHGTTQPLLDKNGNEITASKTITADARDMTVEIEFSVDTSIYRNQTTVVFEKLYHPNAKTGVAVEVANHEEPNDEAQSVHYPEIKTHAIDKDTGGHIGNISKTAVVKDKVSLDNLIPGMKYTVKGVLHFQNDVKDLEGNEIFHKGDAVKKNGEYITAEKSFTAESASEEHVLEFSVDSSILESATVVAFEKLYHPENNVGTLVEVVQHEDLEDEKQSVHYPRIGTIASDGLTADHVGATEENSITDIVKYENLIPGQKYRLKGVVMDKKTGRALEINGEKIESDSGWFTAETANGTRSLTFNIDASKLDGETVVCYEKLYTPQETDWTDEDKDPIVEVEITNHEDINDEAQTIHYPKVTTNARDNDTDDHVGAVKGEAQVKDTVTLENLIKGQKYTVRGTLMKFGTTQPVLTAEGEKVTAEKEIAATDETMTIELEFDKYDSSIVRGETTVCFEYLYHPNAETGEDVEVATHEVPDEEAQSVHYPWIRTIAVDSETGDHVGSIFGRLIDAFRRALGQDPKDSSGIIDTVEYRNLLPNEEYVIEGTLMNKESGEAIKDANGNVITASTTIKAGHQANGEAKVNFSVDTSLLQNVTVVCYEKLMHKNPVTEKMIEVDRHEDLNDEDQSVHEVELKTTAVDTHVALEGHEDKHTADATGETVIDDAVDMKNLVKEMEYTLKGTLHYQDNGEAVKDSSGAPYESSVTFKAESDSDDKRVDQTVHVFFSVDGKALEGRTVVVYEELFHNGKSISVHADQRDEAQSVCYPWIRTTAVDNANNAKETQVNEETVIKDIVKFRNLLPGKYVIEGVLMDKNTGESIKDAEGNPITQTDEFVIESKEEGKEGERTLLFTFNSTELADHIAVAYENLYLLDEEDADYKVHIATHEDINDEDQSVRIIDIATHLTDVMDNSDEGEEREKAEWNDNVSYWGLKPGKEYIMKGILMDKETEKPFIDSNGSEVTAEARFTPEESCGSVDLKFTANTIGLAGKTVVAFEKLYPSDLPETEIARHEDITDPDQSVNIIKIRTNASDASTGHNVGYAREEATILDTVTYTNLTPGREYLLKAKMMDKKTERPLLVNDAEVTSELTFTPEEKDGSVDVEFTIDTSALAGETFVAFEVLFNNEFSDTPIAHHEDINDEAQSIHVPKIATILTDASTRDHITYADEKAIVIDKVKYENLVPGLNYRIEGSLVNKKTGEPIDASASLELFTPETAKGIKELTFEFDASVLKNEAVVAFEELYIEAEESVLVADHKDLTDEDQITYIPEALTKATFQNGIVSDTVEMKNLLSGKKYLIKGWLVDKNGDKIEGSDATTTIKTKSSDEAVAPMMEATLKLKTGDFSGRAVAFEEVYLVKRIDGEEKTILVAEHKDIDDKDQTVTVPAKTPDTGDNTHPILMTMVFILSTLLFIIQRKRMSYSK